MNAEATNSGEPGQSDKFYREAIEVLQKASIPFLMGGAYAFGVYTGIHRNTKDFDLFQARLLIRQHGKRVCPKRWQSKHSSISCQSALKPREPVPWAECE